MKHIVYVFTEGSGKRTKYCAQVKRGRSFGRPACAKTRAAAVSKAIKSKK